MAHSSPYHPPLFLILLCACQDAPAPTMPSLASASTGPEFVEFKNGTRLAGKRIEMNGAEPRLIGIHDTLEHVDCTFLRATDDTLRCLPNPQSDPFRDQEFADPNCREPVYSVPAALDLKKGVTVAVEDLLACEAVHHYAVKLFTPFAGTTYRRKGKSCVADVEEGPLYEEIRVVPRGERPPSHWVQGEISLRPGSGRVRLNEIHSADGARFSHELFDQELGSRCTAMPIGVADPNLVCLPPQGGYGGSYFGDPLCNTPPLGMSFGTCERPAVIAMNTDDFRSAGKAWTGPVYSWDGDRCSPWEANQPRLFKFHELGAPLGDSPFATLAPTQVGPGPVTFTFATLDGEARITSQPDYMAFDALFGTTCHFVRSPKDGIRCLPDEGFYRVERTMFEDSHCTAPVVACEECEGKEVAVSLLYQWDPYPLVDIRRIEAEASGLYFEATTVNGRQACRGPFDVRDWRGPKRQPIPLPHLWRVGAATSWNRFEQAFIRTDVGQVPARQ